MNKNRKIEEHSLVDRLVLAIRDSILNGEIEPGAHIGIKSIAEDYGVSMIPVREALARLLASRLVRVENNRGYFVAEPPTPDKFRQFIEARELFECSVIGMGFENAEAADLKKLRDLNDRMRKVAVSKRRDQMVKWSALNVDFHQVMVGLARNSYLSNQYADLSFGNMHVQLVRSLPREFPSLGHLVAEHEKLIAALEKQDRESFFSVLSAHIRNIMIDD